jgi:transcriptional regulator with XRE-family HTH domain
MVTIGTKIKLLRALFEIPQSELARRVNISQPQLSLIESGLVTSLTDEVVNNLQQVFGGIDLNDPRIEQFAKIRCQPIAA